MMMRYHWGLGIGHTYSHATTAGSSAAPVSAAEPLEDDPTPESDITNVLRDISLPQNEKNLDHDDPELGFENRQDDWVDAEEDDEEEGSMDGTGDEELLEFSSMYGPRDD
jgi:hypothetical protein